MRSKINLILISPTLTIILFTASLIFITTQHSYADTIAPPSTICKSTPYPSYCNGVLEPSNSSSSSPANVYYYGRVSVQKSISAATKFLTLIEKYLQKSKRLTASAVQALEDCEFLARSNLDYLASTFQTVNRTSSPLPGLKADDIQTLLSAILTNAQTCFDGIHDSASAWTVKNGIMSPLSNDTQLYSVSLALFTKGWVPKSKKSRGGGGGGVAMSWRKQLRLKNGKLNLKMSEKNQAIYQTVSGRRMLQTSGNSNNVSAGSDQVLVTDIVVVSQDGLGNFTTINDAVNAAPSNSDGSMGYFLIYVTAGVYEEYVSIGKNKRYLMMLGDGINQTIITGSHNVVDGWTTFNSSTFAVVGTGFVAVNMTFRNTAGPSKHQAVAVRNGADLSTFYSCSFEGYQDTLYTHSLRQFYRECDIYGTVDFIFGNAAVVFQGCNIYPRLPMPGQFNTVTAQGKTDPNQNTGTSIQGCAVRPADDLAKGGLAVQTYLGRPWKNYSTTVVMQSFVDGFVSPAGWAPWSGDFALSTLYYAEFNNKGPGSDTSGRVTWPGYHVIGNASDVANFTVSSFLLGDDWIPQSGVPYTGSGLL